jgi:hypothetical protein
MRKLLVILCFFSLTSCGIAENIGQNCGGDLKSLCHAVFGGDRDNDQDEVLDDHQDQIDAIKQQVQALEIQNSAALTQIAMNQSQINVINSILPTLDDQAQIDSLQAQINALTTQIGTPVTGLQAVVTNNTVLINQLMSNHNVTKLVDPCGDGPGFDEVFLRTSTGNLIASFSQNSSGLNTRFAVIPPGTYNTTDGTGCTFTVGLDLSVTPSVEY